MTDPTHTHARTSRISRRHAPSSPRSKTNSRNPKAKSPCCAISSMCVVMLAAEALLVPMVALLFQAPLFGRPLLLLALLLTGTVGFAAVGTLFAAMLVRARTRDIMLPILLYPVTIPVLIAGVRGTSALLQSTPDEAVATMWVAIVACFDVVFITFVCRPLMTE